MDKFLRPQPLNIDADSASAADEWEMWLANFNAFVDAIDSSLQPDKLALLRAHISCNIFKLIKHIKDYDEAIEVLQARFVKPKSEVYSRHRLATCRQQAGETLDQFLDSLKSLAADCSFKATSAEEAKSLAIRDAFISGMASNTIRQRLLENLELKLDDAVKQARTLELAQVHSESYRCEPRMVAATTEAEDTNTPNQSDEVAAATRGGPGIRPQLSASSKRCYFCGGRFHARVMCRAKNATCAKCGKLGHFAQVCQSSSEAANSKRRQLSSASILASTASKPNLVSVSHAVTEARLNNGAVFEVLIDTGSSKSFIRPDAAAAANLKIQPASGVVSMASAEQTMQITGCCWASLTMAGKEYPDTQLYVMNDLCASILLGHDFLRQHESVSVSFGGSQPPLELCSLAAVSIDPPTIFGTLTRDCHPVQVPSRRFSDDDRAFIKSETERLLEEGVIVPSRSPWRAQVAVVKQGSKKRMVVDYSQTVNRFTNLNAYPIPAINEVVEKIAKYKYFSSIDLKTAYHQIPIRDDERQYTAFEADGRLMEFTRIPFGITNGVACFQQVLDDIIRSEDLLDTVAYVDDITVCGRTREEHDFNLEKFRQAARKYGLTINEDKTRYAQTSVTTLGHVIQEHKISPDPERMKPLLEMAPPGDAKARLRVLGLLSHYAKWVPNFSEKIRPIVECNTFPMSENAISAFSKLKQEISQASLSAIDDKAPFVVETDASAGAIAASLTQDGRPVAFFSRSLSPSEKYHSAVEREACAVVEALRKWRHFLVGRHFQLITDQQSVRYMFDNKNRGKIKNDKILRWRLELTCFSFDITFRPGVRNVVADALSRAPCASTLTTVTDLCRVHNSLCHPGIRRMWHIVRCRNLPFSLEDVKTVIKQCQTCAEIKPKFSTVVNTLIKATRPFERLSVDFKGPLPSKPGGNKYLLTVVDEFSRFVFAFPTKDTSSESAIRCLCSLFSTYGMPEYVHSDRGSAFTSGMYRQFMTERGIATSYSSAYNPRGNGQVERYNGVLWRTIRLALHSRGLVVEDWETVLPDALHSMRSLLCVATNKTPHELFLSFPRKATYGESMPSWLVPNSKVLMRKAPVVSKYGEHLEPVTLLHVNPQYARVLQRDGKETTVSIRRLAPNADRESQSGAEDGAPTDPPDAADVVEDDSMRQTLQSCVKIAGEIPVGGEETRHESGGAEERETVRPYGAKGSEGRLGGVKHVAVGKASDAAEGEPGEPAEVRKSVRMRRLPVYLKDYVTSTLFNAC